MSLFRMILLAAAMLSAAALPAAPSPQPTAQEEALLKRALDRGALMFAYDRAAWVGSDDMATKAAAETVGGWVVDGPMERPTLVFIDKDRGDPKAVYVATFDRGRIASARVLGPADDRSLTPERRRLIAARAAATNRIVEETIRPCGKGPFNTVVLPPERPGGPTLVYFMTPQATLEELPFGGHYLVEVDLSGKAGPVRKFTNSCISLPIKPPGKHEVPMGVFISHLLDPVPTEIHVFSALAAAMPVTVVTSQNDKLWSVEPPAIKLVGKAKR